MPCNRSVTMRRILCDQTAKDPPPKDRRNWCSASLRSRTSERSAVSNVIPSSFQQARYSPPVKVMTVGVIAVPSGI
jgi:hypothetical protein